MKPFVQSALVLTGCLPLAAGIAMNRWMMDHPESLPPFLWIGVLSLLLWAAISFAAKYWVSTRLVVLLLNLAACVDLILAGVQELILGRYWPNIVGVWSQLFYLPVLRLGFGLTAGFSSVFPAYAAGFLLLVLASYAGCKLRRKIQKES